MKTNTMTINWDKDAEAEIAQHNRHCGVDGVWRPCDDAACGHCVDHKTNAELRSQARRNGYCK